MLFRKRAVAAHSPPILPPTRRSYLTAVFYCTVDQLTRIYWCSCAAVLFENVSTLSFPEPFPLSPLSSMLLRAFLRHLDRCDQTCCARVLGAQMERTEASVELLTNPQLKEKAQQVLPAEGLDQLQRVDAMLGEKRRLPHTNLFVNIGPIRPSYSSPKVASIPVQSSNARVTR